MAVHSIEATVTDGDALHGLKNHLEGIDLGASTHKLAGLVTQRLQALYPQAAVTVHVASEDESYVHLAADTDGDADDMLLERNFGAVITDLQNRPADWIVRQSERPETP